MMGNFILGLKPEAKDKITRKLFIATVAGTLGKALAFYIKGGFFL
jgi:hypothetical protein